MNPSRLPHMAPDEPSDLCLTKMQCGTWVATGWLGGSQVAAFNDDIDIAIEDAATRLAWLNRDAVVAAAGLALEMDQ